ncbi:MAG: tetratricopeptide repeat protein, partial [Lysobacteraceae bacterium]
ARLDETALRQLARNGGGDYANLQSDASDLTELGVLDHAADATMQHGEAGLLRWRDDGPFVLLALLPLVALGFRRGWLAIMLLAVFAMPMQRASAADTGWWNGLWQRADQRADHALRTGDATTANALARTPEQRAAAAYRNGQFAAAANAWSGRDSADANYNRGNALAQMQRYPDAIAAYERALQLRPGMADAKANLALVRRQQQQKQQQKQQQQDQQPKDHQGHNQQQQGQQQGEQQHSGNQQQDQQQSQQVQQQQKQQQSGKKRQDQQGRDGQQQEQQQGNQQQKDGQQDSQQQNQAAPDPGKQKQADAAERKALEQALEKGKQDEKSARQGAVTKESTAQREQRQAVEALLQRVPDDPGGLLRRKFALEYARRQQEGDK